VRSLLALELLVGQIKPALSDVVRLPEWKIAA
jgi:hypothetical protein